MPISLSKAQSKAISSGFLNSVGESKIQFVVTSAALEEYGVLFKQRITELINQRQVVGSGKLSDSITPVIVEEGDTAILQIRLLDYYDYPNQGVKGVRSSKNAPASPYKYKSYRMNEEGRASIRNYILSGKAKVRLVRNDKAAGIGLERKGISQKQGKSLIDRQTNQLIYLIKRYGIKATNYFTDAFKETMSDFEVTMSEAVGRDIVLTLDLLNKKK